MSCHRKSFESSNITLMLVKQNVDSPTPHRSLLWEFLQVTMLPECFYAVSKLKERIG